MKLSITKVENRTTNSGKPFLQCEGKAEDGSLKSFSAFFGKEKFVVGKTIDVILTTRGDYTYGKPAQEKKKIYRSGPPEKDDHLIMCESIVKTIFGPIFESVEGTEAQQQAFMEWYLFLKDVLDKEVKK